MALASSRRPGCYARASCRPSRIRALRNLTRYRKTQIQERAREANRLHKALEDTGSKLDCGATDIPGVLGRAMLDPVGQRHDRTRGARRSGEGPVACQAAGAAGGTGGRFGDLHQVWIGAILAHLDFLDAQIENLTDAIGERIAPSRRPLSCSARSMAFNGSPLR